MLTKNLRKNVPDAEVESYMVQRMVSGYEVIIGGIRDEQFDHCISFGLGGIYTEIFEDVSFRVVPITKKDAIEMIRETKAYRILKGYRNRPRADIDALIETLLKTSKLLDENPRIIELDLNPVFSLPRGAVVADVRIITD